MIHLMPDSKIAFRNSIKKIHLNMNNQKPKIEQTNVLPLLMITPKHQCCVSQLQPQTNS
jgi:hypothetical protein